MSLWSSKIIQRFPAISAGIFITADVAQIFQMVYEHSAKGQSLLSWIFIITSLILWLTFFLVRTPNERWAINSTIANIVVVTGVLATVIYFKL